MSVMRSVELFAGNYSFLSSFLSSFFWMVTGNLGMGQKDHLYGYPFGQPIWLSFWSTPISTVTMRCVILLIFLTSLCHFLIYLHADGI